MFKKGLLKQLSILLVGCNLIFGQIQALKASLLFLPVSLSFSPLLVSAFSLLSGEGQSFEGFLLLLLAYLRMCVRARVCLRAGMYMYA